MTACVCTVDLRAIQHLGEFIGNDWSYTIVVNGRERTLSGTGANQEFRPGAPHGVPRWTLTGHECGETVAVRIQVRAMEVDLLFDDEGGDELVIRSLCPPEGKGALRLPDQRVRARVTEDLGWFRGGYTNVVTFSFDIELSCDPTAAPPDEPRVEIGDLG